MGIYENIVILNASLPDEEINSSVAKIKNIIINAGCEILKTDIWGKRKLTYEIKKQNKGFYVLFIYKTTPAAVKKIEELYKVFDPIIKYMIIKLGPKQIQHLENIQTADVEHSKSEV